ncbi:MAG: FAD:protein FMN transferase [Paenibacillaceae bacterium]
MNTAITAIGYSDEPLPYWQRPVTGLFADVERTASRFLVNSGLSRLNRALRDQPVSVPPLLMELLQRAWEMAGATDYLFQPFIGTLMKRLGYDCSFEQLDKELAWIGSTDAEIYPNSEKHRMVTDAAALSFDRPSYTVTRRITEELDLGGIGKGWTVGRAAALMRDQFHVTSGLVDAGGDIAVWSDEEPWCIGIQDPEDEEKEVLQLWVKEAGIATSNVLHRRWKQSGREFHHIVDVRTGLPAESDVIQATVLAPKTDEAEVTAKILCMLGSEDGASWIASRFPQHGYIMMKTNGEMMLNRKVKDYALKVV